MEIKNVSIIIPFYNQDLYFDSCIESALAQTYTNTEIIIINDGEIIADGTSKELIDGAKELSTLTLSVENADDESIENMKAKIPSITLKATTKTNNLVTMQIEYSSKSDPRKDIFNYAVEHKWIILEMSESKRNLEDIFRNLTSKGVSGDA